MLKKCGQDGETTKTSEKEADELSTAEWRSLATLGPRVYPGVSQ